MNIIFSASHENSSSLHDGMEGVLVGLQACLTITKRLAEKSPSASFQKGSDCLCAMSSEIKKIDSSLMLKQVFSR